MKNYFLLRSSYYLLASLLFLSLISSTSHDIVYAGDVLKKAHKKKTVIECPVINECNTDGEIEGTYSGAEGEQEKFLAAPMQDKKKQKSSSLLNDRPPKSSPWLSFSQPNTKRLEKEKKATANGLKPIYGDDNRLDWGGIKNLSVHKNAKASVALFSSNFFSRGSNKSFKLHAYTHGVANNLCKGEPFRRQYAGAFCSGVLIAKNLVATAGHCVREISEKGDPITKIRFVFDYHSKSNKHRGNTVFKNERVFYGKKVIAGKLSNKGEDWAIVQLDRDVTANIASPVKSSISKNLKLQQELYVIGYPSGVPLKYAPGGSVRDNKKDYHITTNLDTFGGNSGSGVFRKDTHELIGLLVRGADDYYFDEKRDCYRAYRCQINGCDGEDVQRIEMALENIKQ